MIRDETPGWGPAELDLQTQHSEVHRLSTLLNLNAFGIGDFLLCGPALPHQALAGHLYLTPHRLGGRPRHYPF